MVKPKVGLYGVLEKSEEGWENSKKLIDLVKNKLSDAGMDVIALKELVGDDGAALKAAEFFKTKDPDILIGVIVTWSFDHLTLTILRHINRPLAILAVPGLKTGSLVGAQQLGCFLTDLNIEYSTFFGPPEEDSTYTPILSYAKAASIKRNMEKGKIGQVGRRCRGMTPASFDEIEVTSLFGPQVENFSWNEIEEIEKSLKKPDIEEIKKRIKSIDPKTKCTDDAISDAAGLYLAIKKIIRENNMIAISLGGYPQYAGRVCLVCSLLGDDGIVSGCCEGDMNSVIAMYLLQEFSGQPGHFGEMLDVNEKENSVISSHCGCCSVKLAADASQVSITPVRLFNKGTCIRFPAKKGPVTYVNLSGRRGTYRICAVEGQAEVTGMVFEGNPVKIKLNVPIKKVLKVVFEKGFGHHWIMGYTHMIEDLKNFCKISGLKGTFLEKTMQGDI